MLLTRAGAVEFSLGQALENSQENLHSNVFNILILLDILMAVAHIQSLLFLFTCPIIEYFLEYIFQFSLGLYIKQHYFVLGNICKP